MLRRYQLGTGVPDFLQNTLANLLIGAIAVLCARMFWLLAQPAASLAPGIALQPDFGAQASASDRSVTVDRGVLLAANPFTTNGDLGAGSGEIVEVTNLDIVLEGVRSSSAGRGVAFLRLPDGETVVVSVGETVLGDVKVEKIEPDHIVLRHRGELEGLYQKDDSVLTAYAGEDDDRSSTLLSAIGQQGARADAASEEEPEFIRSTITDNSALIRTVRLDPHTEDGALVGYRVSAQGTDVALREIGFAPADIIRSVNGRVVSRLDAQDLDDLLTLSHRIRFDVLRGDRPIQIIVSVESA